MILRYQVHVWVEVERPEDIRTGIYTGWEAASKAKGTIKAILLVCPEETDRIKNQDKR